MTVTKAELAREIYERSGINKREAMDMVNIFFDTIRAKLASGEEVKISNFGKFGLRQKSQRPGRNPKTGLEVPIKARRVVIFHTSPRLKTKVESVLPRS